MNLVEYCRENQIQCLLNEWDVQKNRGIQPKDFTAGSEKKVWWKCVHGHEWQASVENRAMKRNACPYCSGKRAWPGFNDLETLYPEIAGQWHPVLNRGLSPRSVRPGCGKKVWWMCKEGHLWEARIYSRTSKKRPGCPFCAGNVKKSCKSRQIQDI